MVLTSESRCRVLMGQSPENDNLRLNVADICFNSGQWEEAERLYLSVLMRRPGCARSVHRLSWIYLRAGRADDALGLIEGAFRQHTERNYQLLYTAGIIHLRLGNFSRAAKYFKSALSAVPPDEPVKAEKIRCHIRKIRASVPLRPFFFLSPLFRDLKHEGPAQHQARLGVQGGQGAQESGDQRQ